MLFLHGLGGSRTAWDPQLQALAADGYRCVAWDAPGYGASAPLAGAWTFARLADAVAELATAAGAEGFHLVGLSLGGMIAQHVALRHPARVRSLALLATSPAFGLDGVTQPDEWRRARLAPLAAGHEPGDFADTVLRAIAGPAIGEEALEAQVAAMARVPSAALRQAVDCLVTHDTRAMLPDVRTPTLVLVGELDEETPPAYARALAELIPGAALEVIPGAGHLLHVEAPDAVNDALRAHFEAA